MAITEHVESAPTNSVIGSLKEKLAKAEAGAKAASGATSDEDREEIELRQSIRSANESREKSELERRELALDRRYDEAKEAFPGAKMTTLMIDDYPDSFIIKHSVAAYKTWQRMIARSAAGKKVDRDRFTRDYAVKSVIDWNGKDLSEVSSPFGSELIAYLTKNPGLVSSIGNAAADLAGAFSKARKS